MLTNAQKEKYISDKGEHCPYCGGEDIRTTGGKDGWKKTSDNVLETVECWDCNYVWVDVYTDNIITDIRELDQETSCI